MQQTTKKLKTAKSFGFIEQILVAGDSAASFRQRLHAVADAAEQVSPLLIVHADFHPIAIAQEGRSGLALFDRFVGAHLGDAGIAHAAVLDLGAPQPALLVRHRARADDCARSQPAGLGRMRDELGEVEGHVHPGIGLTEQAAVDLHPQGQMQLVVVPRRAEFVGRECHRAER